MVKIGINGFGRIGRVILRAILSEYADKVKVAAINTSGSMPIEGWAQLFEYDSVYRVFKGQVKIEKGKRDEIGVLTINGSKIPVLAQKDPGLIPWQDYGVEIVVESTGVFRDRQSASAHFKGGAKKVIISAPAEQVKTFVIGVNEKQYKGDLVISNASCTTNCVAPVTKIMMENFGIQKGFLTTVHAYTADQELVDGSHQDLRRARAAAINIVPTTTGATKVTAETLPALKGLFDGMALRVPVVCGSISDFTFITTKRISVEQVKKAFIEASKKAYKGIVATSDKPLVSSDIIGNSASAIVDLPLIQVLDGDLVKIVAWYDNEWGYSCRLIEEVLWINKR